MQMLIDFTSCQNGYRDYGGSDSKRSIEYNGEKYMLKLPEVQVKTNNLQTSHVNNVFSEYLGSHIIASLGLPVHETLLGTYSGQPVVACKDFTGNGYQLHEFSWMMRSWYEKSEIGRIPTYKQLYDVMENHPDLKAISKDAIARYWDTFVADALIGNFDRHKGNWGYLVNEVSKDIKLAPIYDCGSCLYPGLAENKMSEILEDHDAIIERMYMFPKAALNLNETKNRENKAVYYDFIVSQADQNCTDAFFRIYSRIDMDAINNIVDNTPLLSENRKFFYKSMLQYRKELILDKAFEKIKTPEKEKQVLEDMYNRDLEKLRHKMEMNGISENSLDYELEVLGLQKKYEKRSVQNLETTISPER